jgi:nonspecific dipeptidase
VDFKHPHYAAARNAIVKVFNTEPDFTREGCSIPVTLTFQWLTGKNVLLLPVGASDDGAHSQNEKLNISNYMSGVSFSKHFDKSSFMDCVQIIFISLFKR